MDLDLQKMLATEGHITLLRHSSEPLLPWSERSKGPHTITLTTFAEVMLRMQILCQGAKTIILASI